MSFSQNLYNIRIKRKLSQKKLAELANVSQASVNYWEKGQRTPSIDAIEKLADALDIPIVELMGKETYTLKTGKGKVFSKEQNKFVDYYGEYLDLTDRAKLLDAYDSLNAIGQKEALKRVDELTLLEKYTKNDPDQDQE